MLQKQNTHGFEEAINLCKDTEEDACHLRKTGDNALLSVLHFDFK